MGEVPLSRVIMRRADFMELKAHWNPKTGESAGRSHVSVFLIPPIWGDQPPPASKVDECVPRAKNVNLRILRQPDGDRTRVARMRTGGRRRGRASMRTGVPHL